VQYDVHRVGVDSNVWWAWKWLFIVIECIVLEDSDDSDDDSNLLDDFDEIKN